MIPVQPASAWAPGVSGIFALDEATYRPAPGANQSILKQVLRSPAHAKAEMDSAKEQTPAMVIGHLTHLACLEPDKYADGLSHHVKPEGMTFTTKDGKAWREDHQDLPIITPDESDAIVGMALSMSEHPLASRIMTTGQSEVCAFAQHDETGLLLKCKLDKVFHDDQGKLWIADLKTTEDAREFSRTAVNFGYDFQAAFYLDILTGLGLEVDGFVFAVVEKAAPHGIICYQADQDLLARGRDRYQKALRIFADCTRSGSWPAYPPDVVALNLPGWVRD